MPTDPVPGLSTRRYAGAGSRASAPCRLRARHGPLPRRRRNRRRVLDIVAQRLGDNYPYFHPLYAGQMLKPPHPVARAAYALAMAINPNNHALDGGRASSQMEIEAVAAIARMFGWTGTYLGHLTSSGTIANLEALWIAGPARTRQTDPRVRTGPLHPQRISARAQARLCSVAS